MPPRRSGRIKAKAVPVKGSWDVLPHGMGVLPTAANRVVENTITSKPVSESDEGDDNSTTHIPKTEASEPEVQAALAPAVTQVITPDEVSTREEIEAAQDPLESVASVQESVVSVKPSESVPEIKQEAEVVEQVTTLRRSKRVRAQVQADEGDTVEQSVPPKKARRTRKQVKTEDNDKEVKTEDNIEPTDQPAKPKRVPRKTKDNPYGLTPGRSPFPDWQAPSGDECEEVYRILADVHGEVKQPATIPAPSLEVAGCGEVPFVLEALMRTLLSGAVTFDGADSMVKAIIAKYGLIEDDLAKGSINWNKVRLSTLEELEDAIRIGGLANRKAKAIKGSLDMVYQDNIDRRKAYLAERETGIPADIYGASEKTKGQKDLEILKTERDILSLDHLHGLSADEAMKQFTKFPGIGVKTAACVILFCLQRPCFAVDTHVHRFSRWLGWAPPKADENDTFSHLEVRCPDHLKYGLHQLFIHHGKQCGRCKMSTVEGTKEWESVVCPLEHLLARAKKMTKVQKKTKAEKAKTDSQKSEEESELSELSEAVEAVFDGMDNEAENVIGGVGGDGGVDGDGDGDGDDAEGQEQES